MKLKIETGIPIPNNKSKELSQALSEMKDGQSVYLSYEEFTKTEISNCISSARLRLLGRGLSLRTIGNSNGRRVWVFKNKNL